MVNDILKHRVEGSKFGSIVNGRGWKLQWCPSSGMRTIFSLYLIVRGLSINNQLLLSSLKAK